MPSSGEEPSEVAIHPATHGLGGSDPGGGIAAHLVVAALETTRIQRVAGLIGGRTAFVTTPPLPRAAPSHPYGDDRWFLKVPDIADLAAPDFGAPVVY